MNHCINCQSKIDPDRLEFLIEYKRPLTCKSCSMEQPAPGYKDKPKVIKSKTDAQLKKINEKYEEIKQARISFVKNDLKSYKKFWKKVNKKRGQYKRSKK
jgi:hypothetical protein